MGHAQKKGGWCDEVQRNMAAVQTHKGDNIFGNKQGRAVTYNHAVSNMTALNVMHQGSEARRTATEGVVGGTARTTSTGCGSEWPWIT
jgi:hypothetical protein